MGNPLLEELHRELKRSEALLQKASSLALMGAKSKKKKKKPSKKQQDKEKKIDQKVRDSLKDRTYRDEDTGNDITFNTALGRNHPKATKDYTDAISKAKQQSEESGGKKLSEEQQDIVNRVLSGNRTFNDLSLGEERNLKEALSTLSDLGIIIGIEIEGLTDVEPPKNEAVAKAVKKRKERSDKGKSRGPYKKRVKKEVLEEVLTEEQIDQVDVDQMVELAEEEVSDTLGALNEREKSRKVRSDKGKKRKKKDDDEAIEIDESDIEYLEEGADETLKNVPVDYVDPDSVLEEVVDGEPLFEQPASVQKDVISDKLEQIYKGELDPEDEEIKRIEGKLEFPMMLTPADEKRLKEELKELRRKRKDLAKTEKDTKTLRSKIDSSVKVLEGLNESQVEQMGISYQNSAKEVADILRQDGFENLRLWLKDELKESEPPTAPPTFDSLNTDRFNQKRKLDQQTTRVADAQEKLDRLVEAETTLLEMDRDSEEYAEKLKELSSLLSNTTADDITDFTSAVDDAKEALKTQKQKLSKDQEKLDSLEKDIEEYPSLQEQYASDLGTYLALKNARDGIINDPEFGLKDFPSRAGEEDQKAHSAMVRKSQALKFRNMEKEDRDSMVGHIDDRIQELNLKLSDDSLSKEDRTKIEGQLANVKATQQALNTVRMINREGVIDGYHEVEDKLLDIARQSESDAWDEAIVDLSTYGSSPQATKEHLRNVVDNLDNESFSEMMGGEKGQYGELLETLNPKYCPGSPVNNAKGVGDKMLGPGEECPNPVPDDIQKMMKEYLSDSFVNMNTIDKDRNRSNTSRKPKSEVSRKKKEQAKFFWRKRKDKFFQFLIDGVDDKGKAISQEDKIAYLEHFRSEWFEGEMKQVLRGGIRLYDNLDQKYDFNQLMEELKKARSIKNIKERTEKLQSIRGRIEGLWELATTSDETKKKAFIFNRSFIDGCYKSGGSKLMQKKSTQYVDYQQRSLEFELGMRVYPFLGGNPSRSGLVVAIFPAIGMVDVQFPHGSMRYPVEDLVVDTSGDYLNIYSGDLDTVPGGVGTVPVSTVPSKKKQASRVASKYMKQAIYWYKKDRTYRQCRDEETPCCPKCKDPLGTTVYKRRGGRSEKLLVCRSCLFIIKPTDIVKG